MTQEEYDGQEEVRQALREEEANTMEADDCCIPPLKFEHVLLPNGQHFLALDGKRGQMANDFFPAFHPAGYVIWHPTWASEKTLRGKLVQILPENGIPINALHEVQLTVIDDSTCEIADKAYKEYTELSKTCADIKASRYELAAGGSDVQF